MKTNSFLFFLMGFGLRGENKDKLLEINGRNQDGGIG